MTRQTFYRRLDALRGEMYVNGFDQIRSKHIFELLPDHYRGVRPRACCPIEMLAQSPQPLSALPTASELQLRGASLIMQAADRRVARFKGLKYGPKLVRIRKAMFRHLGLDESRL